MDGPTASLVTPYGFVAYDQIDSQPKTASLYLSALGLQANPV
jgi:hypothetical protein